MEKTSNKIQHHGYCGTIEFISSISAILTNTIHPSTSAGGRDLD